MDWQKDLKIQLKTWGVRPSKHLGQHFLIDGTVLQKILAAGDLKKSDIVLEIGPGLGTLTRAIAEKVKKVIAVEKDQRLYQVLQNNLKGFQNIKIIQGDILKINNWKLPTLDPGCSGKGKIENYKIVANLPYYITSPVIRKFLEAKNPPKLMVLMVQKEVAQRICSRPPTMSLLSVSVQFYAKPKVIAYVSKKAFWPQPKVDSAILQIKPLPRAEKKLIKADLFFKITKAGFSHPRKQLINNLSKNLKINKEKIKNWLLKNKIRPEQRAETLTIKDWLNLAKSYYC